MALTRKQFEQTYHDLETPLFNFALRWIFNSPLAEELVHEAFVRIWKRRDEVELLTIRSLLYKTVQNLALNEIRKRKLRRTFQDILEWVGIDSTDASNMEEHLIGVADLKSLELTLSKLPTDFREVLMLSEFSDLSYSEIAEVLDIAEGTVASRKNRALQMLREEFKKLEGNR